MSRRQCLLALLLGVMTVCFWVNPIQAAVPRISASAYCLLESDNGQVLLMKNGDTPKPIASTTKIMTAILAVEYCQMNEKARVSSFADRTPEYTIGLRAGQELTVQELLKVALIRSANDAAVVLAEHVAGDEALFGHLMSMKAFCLGACHTHFVNASGLPSEEGLSTAYDLALVSRYALANPQIREIVGQRQEKFQHPAYSQPLTISNTNTLLDSYPGANGLKTGTTNAAGKCLVGSANRQGRELIAVVLKSGDRTGDCIRLLDYGFKDTHQVSVIDNSQSFKELSVNGGDPPYLNIYPASGLQLWLGPVPIQVEKRVSMDYSLEAPLTKGKKVGILEVFTYGKLVQRIDLVAGNSVAQESSWLIKLGREIFFGKGNKGSGKE
ncbi:MAG TPA: D-alanyl-D-alanine carboxypeptidase family protein [Syntrophomonadaceae bacterium]|nr:D-alanyl-D-alanine carboxypeptidase family protein [Syntrophomonadaceae bacterium]